jgi:hypothetical protein
VSRCDYTADYDFIPVDQELPTDRLPVAEQREMWLDGNAKRETCTCGVPVALMFSGLKSSVKIPIVDSIVTCGVCKTRWLHHSEFQGTYVRSLRGLPPSD